MKFVPRGKPDIPVFIFRIGSEPILRASLDVFKFFTRQDLSRLKY